MPARLPKELGAIARPQGASRGLRPVRGDAGNERAVKIERVDHPTARPILLGIGDEHVVTEGLDVEGGEAGGKVRIREGSRAWGSRREMLVEDIDGALTEVRGVQECADAVVGDREAPVVGPGGGSVHSDGRQQSWRCWDHQIFPWDRLLDSSRRWFRQSSRT
jgi:hypothetical protein